MYFLFHHACFCVINVISDVLVLFTLSLMYCCYVLFVSYVFCVILLYNFCTGVIHNISYVLV